MAGLHIRRNASGAPINDNGTPVSTPAVSRTLIPAPAPASVRGPPRKYTDKNLQKTIKLALESFVKSQKYGQANSAPWDKVLKARNPDFYYRSLHIECYYFCRQCENHFDTAGATDHKRVPFAASFL